MNETITSQMQVDVAAMQALSEEETQKRDALVVRLLQSMDGAADLLAIYLGQRLGFYQALNSAGPANSSELAVRAGAHERYAREWLEHQAVTGLLDVAEESQDPAARRYRLPRGNAEVLLEGDSLNYLAPVSRAIVSAAQRMDDLVKAYRNGGGVPYTAYGADMREAQEGLNRPMFINLLGTEWLPSQPDVHARLQADPPARVADIACGAGWSSIAIARAYPRVQVDGYDNDEASIVLARQNARDAGVADRVNFQVRDAATLRVSHLYDLATVFEAIHDMAQPVEALRHIKQLLATGGSVIIADEHVSENFTAPGDDVERFFYSASILLCLPTGMAEQPSLGTGAVIRPAIMRRYAREAGFREVEILPIENPFFRFYRLHA